MYDLRNLSKELSDTSSDIYLAKAAIQMPAYEITIPDGRKVNTREYLEERQNHVNELLDQYNNLKRNGLHQGRLLEEQERTVQEIDRTIALL